MHTTWSEKGRGEIERRLQRAQRATKDNRLICSSRTRLARLSFVPRAVRAFRIVLLFWCAPIKRSVRAWFDSTRENNFNRRRNSSGEKRKKKRKKEKNWRESRETSILFLQYRISIRWIDIIYRLISSLFLFPIIGSVRKIYRRNILYNSISNI